MLRQKQLGLVIVVAWLSVSSLYAQSAIYDPATGIMTIDSGSRDLVAVFIEGPDVSQSGCNLCDGMNMPGVDALAGASTWTLGFINGASQWIRTNPLQGRGFVGVIADYYVDGGGVQQPWPDDIPPFLDFPDQGLGIAQYPGGLSASAFGSATFVSDNGDVTVQTCFYLTCNAPPIANDDDYVATLGTVLNVPAPGLLANDDDPEGDPLTAQLDMSPMFGEVMVNFDGSFEYVAPPIGSVPDGTVDTFTYLAVDDFSNIDQATVSVTLLVPEPRTAWPMILVAGMIGWRRRRTR